MHISKYSSNRVFFTFPDTWKVIEDDFDETIRAITLECPNGGLYMIDIYNTEQAPTIESYISRQLGCFVKELPMGNKLIEGPFKEPEKAINRGIEILGVRLEFIVSTLLRNRIKYINRFYKVEQGVKTGLISSQFAIEESEKPNEEGFEEILRNFYIETG